MIECQMCYKMTSEGISCEHCGGKLKGTKSSVPGVKPIKNETTRIRYEDAPSVGEWFVKLLILCIPFVNIIVLIYWALSSSSSENIKNFSRASLIFIPVGFILALLFSPFK